MKLFHYYNREILHLMFAMMTILLVIMVAVSFVKYLALAADGSMPLQNAIAMLGMILPGFVGLLIPLSLFLAIVMGMGRLISDNELIIGFAGGMSWFSFLRHLLKPALILALMGLVLSFVIVPKMNDDRNNLAQISSQSSNVFDLIQTGRFFEADGKVVYVEGMDFKTHESKNIFVYQENQGEVDVVLAPTGLVTASANNIGNLTLSNGSVYQVPVGNLAYRIISFNHVNITLIPTYDLTNSDLSATNTLALLRQHDLPSQVELSWRLALPIVTVIVTVLGVGLADLRPRQSRYLRLFYAVGIFIVYFNVESIAKSLVLAHKLSLFTGLFLPHLIVMLLAIILILLREGYFNFVYQWMVGK